MNGKRVRAKADLVEENRKVKISKTDICEDDSASTKDTKASCSQIPVTNSSTVLDTSAPSKYFRTSDPTSFSQNASVQSDTVTSQNGLQGQRLTREFYNVPGAQLAKALLGQRLVRKLGSQRLSGRIVETEAYLGLEDKAAHSYQGKRTDRNEAMFMQPGTSYVYNIYGMYCCFNISSKGEGCAVLIRALEPVEGKESMRETRGKKLSKGPKEKDLLNGPSKLCQALHITKPEMNRIDLTDSKLMWLEKDTDVTKSQVVESARINIGYAGDWKEKPLRFYILGNTCVSTRDKAAELQLTG